MCSFQRFIKYHKRSGENAFIFIDKFNLRIRLKFITRYAVMQLLIWRSQYLQILNLYKFTFTQIRKERFKCGAGVSMHTIMASRISWSVKILFLSI